MIYFLINCYFIDLNLKNMNQTKKIVQFSQSALKSQYQKAFTQRFQIIKKFYDMRHSTLLQTIREVYNKIVQDELFQILKRDKATQQYISQRIKQIFEQVVLNQRQLIIQKLGMQFGQLKSEFYLQELQNKKCKEDLIKMSEEYNKQNDALRFEKQEKEKLENMIQEIEKENFQIQNQLKNEIASSQLNQYRKMEEENQNLKIQIQQFNKILSKKQNYIQDLNLNCKKLSQDYQQLNSLYQKLQIQFNSSENQNNQLRNQITQKQIEYNKSITLLEQKIALNQLANKQTLETIKKQYKQKIYAYKKKIQQYKNKFNELVSQIDIKNKEQTKLVKHIEDLEYQTSCLMQQNEKKLNQIKNLKEYERMELQKKHEFQMRQFQNHYEKILQEKNQLIQSSQLNHMNALREQQKDFRLLIQNKVADYNINFIKKRDHQNIIEQKSRLIQKWISESNQKDIKLNEVKKAYQFLEQERNNYQQKIQQIKQKLEDYEQILTQQSKKKKILEQENQVMRITQKKNRYIIQETEDKIKTVAIMLQQKNRTLAKINHKFTTLQYQYKQLEQRFIKTKQLFQHAQTSSAQLIDKIKGLNKQNQNLKSQINKIQVANINHQNLYKQEFQKNINLKKQSSESIALQLQKIIKLQKNQQTYIENISALNSKAQENRKKITFQEEKIKQLQHNLIQQSNYKIETQKTLRQFNIKETQLQTRMIQLQQQLYNKQQDFAKIKSEFFNSQQRSLALKNNFGNLRLQINKKVNTQLIILMKQLYSVKDYLLNMKKLYNNQINLWMTTLTREIQDILKKKQIQWIKQRKELKQTVQRDNDKIYNAVKQKIKTESNQIIEAQIKQIQQLKDQIKIKQKEFQVLESTLHKSRIIINQQQLKIQEQKRWKNQSKNYIQQLEQERQTTKQKINQLVQALKEQKQELLNQNNSKHQQYINQINQLKQNIKNLKKQIQEFKQSISVLQLKQSRIVENYHEKETQISRAIKQKQLIIQNLHQSRQSQQLRLKEAQDQIILLRQDQQKKKIEIQHLNHKINQIQLDYSHLEDLKQQNQREIRTLKSKLEDIQTIHYMVNEKKNRLENEMLQMRNLVGRSVRNVDNQSLRMAKVLDTETKQLNNKVKQLRKINNYLGQKDSLRS